MLKASKSIKEEVHQKLLKKRVKKKTMMESL